MSQPIPTLRLRNMQVEIELVSGEKLHGYLYCINHRYFFLQDAPSWVVIELDQTLRVPLLVLREDGSPDLREAA